MLLDTFLVRIAGVDSQYLVGMRALRTTAALAALRTAERMRDEEGRRLADGLFAYVPSALCANARRAIVRIRRDLHNGRVPEQSLLETASTSLPQDLTRAIAAWCSRTEGACHVLADAAREYRDEVDSSREALKVALCDERFMSGLALSSPDLFVALAEYASDTADNSSSRARRREHSLLQYLTRATTKTSPFSTFTIVGSGEWQASTGALLQIQTDRAALTHYVRPNALHIQRLWSAYLQHPQTRAHIAVRLHPGVRVVDEALRYVALYDNPEVLKRHFGALERSVRIPLTASIRRVLYVLQENPAEEVLLTELLTELGSSTSMNGSARAVSFVDQLIGIGLLQPSLRIPDQALSDLPTVSRACRQQESEFSAAFAEHVDTIHRHIGAYAAASGAGRVHTVGQVRSAIDRAAEHVGASLPTIGSVLYEDVTFDRTVATASRGAWSSIADDLRILQVLQPIWDPQMRYRLAAADLFKSTYGECGNASVVEFLRILKPYTDAWLNVGQTEGAHLSLKSDHPEIATLNSLYAELCDHVYSLARLQQSTVQISRDFLQSLIDRLPHKVRGRRASNAFFCQPILADDSAGIVLNHMYPGLGKFYSRFLGMLAPSVLSAVRSGVPRSLGPETKAIELPGVFGSNVNFHPPLADLELRYPGIESARPENELVDVADLELSYDVTSGLLRLRHAQTGQDLHPFFPGLMVPLLLPPTLQSLNLLFGDGLAEVSPHAWCEHHPSYAVPSDVHSYPRMSVGAVVVARRSWYMRASDAPCADAKGSDFEEFRGIARWRESLGLPQHVFVRTLGTPRDPNEGVEGYWRRLLGAKPQYVDWTNPLLVRLFAKLTRADPAARLVINEMLPDFSQSPQDASTGPVVSELVLQLDSPPSIS